MKPKNIGNYATPEKFITAKLEKLSAEEKTFSTLFESMFSEPQNIMAERTSGFRVIYTTYGEARALVIKIAGALRRMTDIPQGSTVGLYMENSLEWLCIFWAILMCGYNPLLMNTKLSDAHLADAIEDGEVKVIISDGKQFSVPTIQAETLTPADGDEAPNGAWGEEVIFMTSGTTSRVKLCAYKAENLYYQICNAHDVMKTCPAVTRYYEGNIKLLMLLPLYHVFGFIAVYLWFGFFSDTFVFLSDMNPRTILGTVKRHKVTHLFAVPLVWERIHKTAIASIKKRGDGTYKKFRTALHLAGTSEIARRITRGAMGEVREALFGDSIQFLVSGGGFISKETLKFFNGIGYHMANGYGMTEIGITSVESSDSAVERNLGAIGRPLRETTYKIDEHGELFVAGRNLAHRIRQGGKDTFIPAGRFFRTHDLARVVRGRYYLCGRTDDLIVPKSGENLNPQDIEDKLNVIGAEETCLISDAGIPILLVRAESCYSERRLREILVSAKSELTRLKLTGVVQRVYVTPDRFMQEGDFKRSRRNITARYQSGEMFLIDDTTIRERIASMTGELEKQVSGIMRDVLSHEIDVIGADDNFFTDLGGTSLDYFVLSDTLTEKYGVDIKSAAGRSLVTLREICSLIQEKENKNERCYQQENNNEGQIT